MKKTKQSSENQTPEPNNNVAELRHFSANVGKVKQTWFFWYVFIQEEEVLIRFFLSFFMRYYYLKSSPKQSWTERLNSLT